MFWDFSVAKSVSLVLRTWPYLLLRAMVFGVSLAIFVVLTASGGVIGHEMLPLLINEIGTSEAGILGTVGGGGLGVLVLRILREYTLYMVKAGHVAVIVRLLDHDELPQGESQLVHGGRVVRERFVEASVLFALDQTVKAVLTAIKKTLNSFGAFVPGLNIIFNAIHAVAETAVTYVDEIILAHNIRVQSTNPWRTSADAAVLYAQNGGTMLKNAFWLTLMMFVSGLAVIALMVSPFALTFDGFVGPTEMYAVVASVALALFMINVILEPFAICSLLQVFTKVTAGQKPDPNWEKRLDRSTPAFSRLRDHVPAKPAPGAVPAE